MEAILKIVMAGILSVLTALGSLISTPPAAKPEVPEVENVIDFSYLQYPDEAVKTLKENGISLKKFVFWCVCP